MLYVNDEPKERPAWRPLESLPDLSHAKVIALDTETKDPNLSEHGPGTFRKDGHLLGISFCTDTGQSGYLPIGHPSGNLDKGTVLRWANDNFGREEQTKVGANILYDLEWLRGAGVTVKGKIDDIQTIEALLDEERVSYSLESLSQTYLGVGKDDSWLARGLEQMGVKAKPEEAKGLMWKLPPEFVGEYAIIDAKRTFEIYEKQLPTIDQQGLRQVYDLEMELIPLILAMRFQGVRVDVDKAERLAKEWEKDELKLYETMHKLTGMGATNIWSAEDIGAACDKLSIKYPRTPKTNAPSFTGSFLEKSPEPFLQIISTIRGLNRLRTKFIETDVLQNNINGRIHCQFHPMRRDEGGTRSGRFSSSKPNLQQVPNLEHSPDSWKIRDLFKPEDGEKWCKLDYSQQEPRILVHYASTLGFQGAQDAVEVYNSNPKADFYQIIVELAGVERSHAKMIYLARTYGLGKANLALKLGKTLDEAQEIADKMDEKVPFIKQINYYAQNKAKSRGYIRTLGGRLCHFRKFELANFTKMQEEYKNGNFPIDLAEAKVRWTGEQLKRAGLHKALNRLIQGSAADMTKKAMLTAWKLNGTVPLLQVHDEIDISVNSEAQAKEMKRIMESAYELKVPIYADMKQGNSWGECR